MMKPVAEKSDSKAVECIKLCLLLLVYVVAVIGVLDIFPIHPDEPSYTDPAASIFQGKGFTSSAWYAQGVAEFWAGNVPLHQLALSLWYRLFGFSMESTRLVNLFYVCISMVFFWMGLVQSKWFPSWHWRIGLVVVCLATFSIGLMPCWGRPDGITLALLCLGFFAWTLSPANPLRLPCLFLIALLAPWAGLQLAVVIAYFGFLLLVFDYKRQWKAVMSLALGTIVGSSLLLCLYLYHNALAGFVASVMPHTSSATNSGVLNPWSSRLGALKDPSFIFTTLAMGVCFVTTGIDWIRTRNMASFRLSALLLSLGIGTPLVLVGLSKMPAYYSFFAVVPTLVIIFYTISHRIHYPRWTAFLILAIVLLAALFGAPWSLAIAWMHREDQPQVKLETFVASVIRSDDVVLYERPAYYPVKSGSKNCYFINWYYPRMTGDEKERLTLLLLDRETFELTSPSIGGKWLEIAGPVEVPNRNTKALSGSDWYRKNPSIELRAYRRVSTP